jgi:cell division protein FtsN
VNIAEKDLADLAFNGLHSHIKKKLEGYNLLTVTQVHQRDLAIESRSKESQESHRFILVCML